MQVVGQPVMKKDAMALVTGKPVFTQDVAPADCLVVKVLRSPHANANILSIKTDAAKKVPGIEAVYCSFIIRSVHRWNVHGDHSDLLYIFYLE
mgnify:CR=1 FL=1